MGKKPKEREWPHTRDELLALAVQKCNDLGRMPSRRAWSHDGFFDFEELVCVLGKGSWERAEFIIQFAWDQQRRKAEELETKVAEPEVASEAKIEDETATAETEPKRSGRGHRYTLEDAIGAWREVCEKLGTKNPTQQQINQLAREVKTPAYGTFLRLFGPRAEWGRYLEDDATEVAPERADEEVAEAVLPSEDVSKRAIEVARKSIEAAETVAKPPEVCEVAVKDVLVKSLEMEVEIDGRPMRLRLRFGE